MTQLNCMNKDQLAGLFTRSQALEAAAKKLAERAADTIREEQTRQLAIIKEWAAINCAGCLHNLLDGTCVPDKHTHVKHEGMATMQLMAGRVACPDRADKFVGGD